MYITTRSAVTRRGIFAARRQAAVSGRRQSRYGQPLHRCARQFADKSALHSTMHDNDPEVSWNNSGDPETEVERVPGFGSGKEAQSVRNAA